MREALLAVAGPVNNDRCVLTNSAWTIDAAELSAAFSFAKVHILNDFEATALYYCSSRQQICIRWEVVRPYWGLQWRCWDLGPGTGLGVACFVPGSQSSIVIASEGGHATMAAISDREDAIIDYLRRQFGHVSAERVVSGSGLENLYRAVIAVDGIEAPKRNAAEITNAALDGCQVARAALDLFCAMLGTFAGNVALMFGARGGVFIAGGIAPRLTEYIARSEFRARFEHKGRFRQYLASIPSSIIVHPAATFMGLRSIAEREDTTISLDRTRANRH